MKFDELVQHLSEMALAGVHRATRDFGLKGRSKWSGHHYEEQGIAIMRNQRLEKKLQAEIDPHNVLPPLHIVLHDVPHPMRKGKISYGRQTYNVAQNRTVMKRAKQLSTPNNIVLIASPAVGGGGSIMSPFAIIHNWAHTMSPVTILRVLGVVGQSMLDLMEMSDEDRKDLQQEMERNLSDLNRGGVEREYDEEGGVLPYVIQPFFAIPSNSDGEFVYNLFYQYVKFGRITFRFATREQLMPYTQKITQLFDEWVNTQKGKVVSTRLLKR